MEIIALLFFKIKQKQLSPTEKNIFSNSQIMTKTLLFVRRVKFFSCRLLTKKKKKAIEVKSYLIFIFSFSRNPCLVGAKSHYLYSGLNFHWHHNKQKTPKTNQKKPPKNTVWQEWRRRLYSVEWETFTFYETTWIKTQNPSWSADQWHCQKSRQARNRWSS